MGPIGVWIFILGVVVWFVLLTIVLIIPMVHPRTRDRSPARRDRPRPLPVRTPSLPSPDPAPLPPPPVPPVPSEPPRERRPAWKPFDGEKAARLLSHEYREDAGAGVLRIPWAGSGLKAEILWHPRRPSEEPRTVACVELGVRSPGTLKIAPPGLAVVVARIYGPQDIRIGDRLFDASYIIKADPETFAARVFSPERRDRVIGSLGRLASLAPAFIDLSRSQLRVGLLARLSEAGEIFELARAAEEWTGFILDLPPPVEIHWIDETRAAIGVCQVCGAGLVDDVVLCVRCRTPHHRECWAWTAECSTFACHETRCEPDGPTRPAAGR